MRKIILFFIYFLSIVYVHGQSVYSFTPGVDPGWASSDGLLTWQPLCNAVATNCIGGYPNNANSTYTSPVIDATCSNASTVLLSFDIIGDAEFNFDFMFFEYSTNGITWTNIVGPGVGLTGGILVLSTITVPGTIPASSTLQIRFRFESDFIFNSTGYQISNLSLDCNVVLPVEMYSMEAFKGEGANVIRWTTKSEINNSHFELERTLDGENFEFVSIEEGQGNSSIEQNYEVSDDLFFDGEINYYRLTQIDFDGQKKVFDLMTVDNRKEEIKLIKTVNTLGQLVDPNFKGVVIDLFSDGSIEKRYQP